MGHLLFTFSNCLRHAFFEGAGYGDFEKISDEDQRRWLGYDPSELAPFVKIQAAVNAHDELIAGLRFIVDEWGPPSAAKERARTLLAKHGGQP